MAKRDKQHTTPTPAAEQPATTAPAAPETPDLSKMLESIKDPDTRARLQRDLASQLAFEATREAHAKAHEERGQALKAKLEQVLTTEDLQGDTFSVIITGINNKVTAEVWPDAKPAASKGTTWTEARRQELADLLRSGVSKAEAAAQLGVSASSVGNCIYSNGKNVKGFLAAHPAE